jgi:hypothetical protein
VTDKSFVHANPKDWLGNKMVEISWGKAFGYGIRFILFIILWAIIGGLIAVAGGLMIASSVNITFNPDTAQFNTTGTNLGGILAGVIVILVGEVVVVLGVISTYFKLMSKLITETGSATQHPPPP